jgi:hypothetical protein
MSVDESAPTCHQPPLTCGLVEAEALRLDCALSKDNITRLAGFVGLLSRWSRRIRLTGSADASQIVTRQLADALVLSARLPAGEPAQRCVDVGAGGGLPGWRVLRCGRMCRSPSSKPMHASAPFCARPHTSWGFAATWSVPVSSRSRCRRLIGPGRARPSHRNSGSCAHEDCSDPGAPPRCSPPSRRRGHPTGCASSSSTPMRWPMALHACSPSIRQKLLPIES